MISPVSEFLQYISCLYPVHICETTLFKMYFILSFHVGLYFQRMASNP